MWAERQGSSLALSGALWFPFAAVLAAVAWVRFRGRPLRALPIALALFTAAISAAAAAGVPGVPAAIHYGNSPLLGSIYMVLGASLCLFFVANPLRFSDGELVVTALVVFSTANGKAWTRANQDFFPLFAALASAGLCTDAVRRGRGAGSWFPVACAFGAWVALCSALGDYPGRGDELTGRVLAGVATGWCTARFLDVRGVERMVAVMALVGGVASLTMIPVLWEGAVHTNWATAFNSRLRLFGLHPNMSGAFLAVHLVIAAALVGRWRGALRWCMAASVVLSGTGLLLTRSRATWAAALGGLVVLLLARRVGKKVWLGLAAAGTLFLTAFFVVSPVQQAVTNAVFREHTSSQTIGQRLYLWDASSQLALDNPVTGVGPGNFFAHARAADYPSYFDGTSKNLHPHNLLLSVAEGTGVVGLLLFLVLLAQLGTGARRAATLAGPERQAGGAVLAAATTLVLSNLFDLGLSQTTFVPTLLWILLGLATVLARPAGDQTDKEGRPPVALAMGLALLFGVRPFIGERLLKEGNTLRRRANNEAALDHWTSAQRFMPWNAGTHMRAARTYRHMKAIDQSLASFERGIRLSPSQPEFRFEYGEILHLETNRTRRAATEIRTALELDPHGTREGPWRVVLAKALGRLGDAPGAAEQMKMAILVKPVAMEIFRTHEDRLLLPVANADPIDLVELVIEAARGVLRRAPDQTWWQNRRQGNNVARTLIELDQAEDALSLVEGMLEATGQSDTSLVRLRTELLGQTGRSEEVGADPPTDDPVDRAHVAFVPHLARALIEEGRPEEAVARVRAALKQPLDIFFDAQQRAETYDVLFDAARALGDAALAREATQGASYFAIDEIRRVKVVERLAVWFSELGKVDETLEVVREGIHRCSALLTPKDREQLVMSLCGIALATVSDAPPAAQLNALRARVRVDHEGPSWRLFNALAEARVGSANKAWELLQNLRLDYPDEGPLLEHLLRSNYERQKRARRDG